jgi:hypothetical protein
MDVVSIAGFELESTATTSSSSPGSRLCIVIAAVFCRAWRCLCGFLIRSEFASLSRPAMMETRM